MKTSFVALLFLWALLGACKKNDSAKASDSPGSPMDRGPAPPILAGRAPAESRGLLTEDKINRFATYQRELVGATADATAMGAAAQRGAGNDPKKVEQGMAGDEHAPKVNAVNRMALEKSGLTEEEASKLGLILTPYYGRLFAMKYGLSRASQAQAGSDETKAAGKDPSATERAMEKMHSNQTARMELIRKDFAEHYGQEALTLVQKHEPDFFPIHDKTLSVALRSARRRPEATPGAPPGPTPAPRPAPSSRP
jgi:hypothetical protein